MWVTLRFFWASMNEREGYLELHDLGESPKFCGTCDSFPLPPHSLPPQSRSAPLSEQQRQLSYVFFKSRYIFRKYAFNICQT